LISVVAKRPFDGDRFQFVANVGGSTMGVDVLDLLGLYLGVAQSVHHDAVGAVAVFGRLRDVEGVPAHAVAHDLGHDAGPATAGKLQFLQHQDAGALANHESVASRVPGPAGFFGIVISGGECAHGGKPAHSHGSNGCFRTSGNHYIGIAARDDLESISDGMGARGAGGAGGLVRATGVVADAHVASGEV